MLIKNEVSTSPISSGEEWEIVVGKDKFNLNGDQMRSLRDAIGAGERGMMFFRKFAISIPHIQCAYQVKKAPPPKKVMIENEHAQTPEEKDKMLKKLEEIRRTTYANLKRA